MKKLVLAAMIGLLLIGIYYVFDEGSSKPKEYNVLIEQGEQYAAKGIYVDAIPSFLAAEAMYPNVLTNEIRLAEIYLEARMTGNFEEKCKSLHEKYPENEPVVQMLDQYYIENEVKETEIEFLLSIKADFPESQWIAERLKELRGVYETIYLQAEELYDFRDYYAVFCSKGKYGIMNCYGAITVSPQFDYIGIFPAGNSSYSYAPVALNNEYYFIDRSGNRKLVPDSELGVEHIGSMSDTGISPVIINGSYTYMSSEFYTSSRSWDETLPYYQGVAAVKQGDKWALMGTHGELTEYCYDSFLQDSYGAVAQAGYVFAMREEKYLLMTVAAEELTEPRFDDVKFFNTYSDYTAAKSGGLWGFIDKSGEWVIEPQYEDADAFGCGLAPVCINGSWVYIDIDQKIVIETQWEQARVFMANGYAPVYANGWRLLHVKYHE